MKKALILRTTLSCIIFLLIVSLGTPSCDDKENPKDDNFRLIEQKIYRGGSLDTRLVFEYEADKLILQKNYAYDNEIESARREFVYMEDSVETTNHSNFNGDWTLSSKYVYVFEGDKMVRTTFYIYQDSVWELQGKLDYQYSGDKLTKESWINFDNGIWTEISRRTYEYKNGLLTRSDAYLLSMGEMQKVGREEAEYTGNKMKTVIKYYNPGDTINGSFKYDFEYEGDVLTRINYFDNEYGWVPAGGKDFTYNEDGAMVMQSTINPEGISSEEYTYEQGKGNYEQFIHLGGGIISEGNYPHPTKSVGQLDSWTVGQLDGRTVGR